MDGVTLMTCSLIGIATFVFWDWVAWFSHKYIMHGFLWGWHKSHHTVHEHRLEKNDLFGLVFSFPSIGLIYYFSVRTYNPYFIAAGLGIFCYGAFYFIFHDIIVHQRIAWRPRKSGLYLHRMIHAHYIHHSRHSKEGCEAFGFLYAPKKYQPKQLVVKNKRQQTQ